jgi:4-hydroxythreonine-4-phosphate dehydrogenase
MKHEENILVGISVGDLNGISGEIILKTFEDSRVLEFCTPVIFASIKVMNFFKKYFKSSIDFNSINDITHIAHGKFNVLNCWKEGVNIKFGAEDTKVGTYALKSLQAATKALKDAQIDVLLTAPIHKHNIQSEAFNFPGHTDYLAKELEGDSLMLMVSEELRVGLLTDHVPVKDVSEHITEALITKKINTVYNSLRKDFRVIKPKIAVLGINPHNYAADSFFGSDNYKNFDAIIASYHDQGLIPFKTLAFGQGVNFTAGLKRVRTSPDHGTAFEIAGKGIANEGSFKEALFTAIKIFRNRNDYETLTANPLKKAPRKESTKK